MDYLFKETIQLYDHKIALIVNKLCTDSIHLTALNRDTTDYIEEETKKRDSLQITVEYARLLDTDQYRYVGGVNDSTHTPHGQGTMTIKTDNYPLVESNSKKEACSVFAHRGDMLIGDFNYGVPTKYTQIDKNGDTLRLDHIPSEFDLLFKIDSTDLKNGPLRYRRHVDITIGDLLAELNRCYKTKERPDLDKFKSGITVKGINEIISFWNTTSRFRYDFKAYSNHIYRIGSDSLGKFVEINVKNDLRIDSVKRKRYLMRFYFNTQWQIDKINHNFWSDDITFCDNVDDSTRLLISFWLREFRLTYGKMSIDTLDQLFHKHAIILVGRVDGSYVDTLPRTKNEYLSNLEVVYNKEKSIQLIFSKISVCRCHDSLNVYDIKLYQHWRGNGTGYNDDGWLSMRWEFFEGVDKPVIYVRAWTKDDNYDLSKHWPIYVGDGN
ncbi:MAG: hypothetical protein PUC50_09285 [Bacteroidales bacterium]|nr:hypothetical protein [Bacteroidales bacterium]